MWKGALFQLSSTDDPKENLETINEMINMAAAKNVDFIALPETANCISNCKTHQDKVCLLYTSPSPRDVEESRMPSSA